MPSTEAARIFLWLAQYPWREVTWFSAGRTIPWYHEPATFPLGRGNEAVLLLEDPARCSARRSLTCPASRSAARPVRWLWVVPITERERLLAADRGAVSLINQLAAQRRSWVVG